MSSPFDSIAVVGAGAVGSYFGAMLARAGHEVMLVGRPAHVRAVERGGLQVDFASGRRETVRLHASTEIAAVRGAGLVLVCVKSTDTAAVAAEMAPHLAPKAVVMSLQNGVENAAMIADAIAGPSVAVGCTVVPTVVYVATAMPEPGRVTHHGRGDLVIGPLSSGESAPGGSAAAASASSETLDAIAVLFAAAQVPVRVSTDVIGELWSKLMVNCAYNAVSGIAQAPYGRFAAVAEAVALQEAVVREVVAVAAAAGVTMPLDAAMEAMRRIAAAMPAQFSSTAQDMARGKPSEIDHLNGFVARRGAGLGVATPANQALHALVKLIEATRAAA